MVKRINLEKNAIALRILLLVAQGETAPNATTISKAIGLELSATVHRLRRLCSLELLYAKDKFYYLTDTGKTALLKVTSKTSSEARLVSATSSPETIRDHSTSIAFDLKDRLGPDEPAQVVSVAKMEYPRDAGLLNQRSARFVYAAYEALLTPDTLIIYGKELERTIASNSYLLFMQVVSPIFPLATELEGKLGIKLRRTAKGILNGKVIMHQDAMTSSKTAKFIKSIEERFKVYDEFGRLRYIIDESFTLEFEAVLAQTSVGDIERVKKLLVATGNGIFDYEKEQSILHNTIEALRQEGDIAMQIRDELRVHRQAYMDLSRMAKKILEYLNQRRL